MATVVNIGKAQSDFSRLVKLAESGEDVVIARNGVPVVRLTRIKPSKPKLPWGVLKGKMWMSEDFDAPLDDFREYM